MGKNSTLFGLLLTVLILKLLIFLWVSILLDRNKLKNLYLMSTGYILFPLTIAFLIKTSKTPPESEQQSEFSLTVRLIQDLYAKYVPKFICPYCKCIKKSKATHHCAICQICVKEYDHHCFWMNTCIGKGNLKFFLGTLCLFVADFSYSFIVSLFMFKLIANKESKIMAEALILLSCLILFGVAPFFYLNFSNYLNSITVRQGFSVKKLNFSQPLISEGSFLLAEDPLSQIQETKRESDYSEASQPKLA